MTVDENNGTFERHENHLEHHASEGSASIVPSSTIYTSTGHSSSSEDLGSISTTPMSPYSSQPTPRTYSQPAKNHSDLVLTEWRHIQDVLQGRNEVYVDGKTLDISRLVAVSR